MIVGFLHSPKARAAVARAALPEEDVVFGEVAGLDAIHRAFPRLVVRDPGTPDGFTASIGLPVLTLGEMGLRHLVDEDIGTAESHIRRLQAVLNGASRATWVDGMLATLARMSGSQLPAGFRGMARRILEYPARYPDLHAVARLTGLSRGAVKARFRRRGLSSPSSHVRWLRALATAHAVGTSSWTVEQSAYRLGFTSGGNLCRAILSATGLTPGDLRSSAERTALQVRFVERFLGPAARVGWADLEDVFLGDSTAA